VNLEQKFVETLGELSGLDLKEKIKLDMRYDWASYLYKNYVHDQFDFDHDTSEEFREKKKQAAK
jgi:hypothetical protein